MVCDNKCKKPTVSNPIPLCLYAVHCTSTIRSVSTGGAGMEGEEAGAGGEKTTKSGHP